ncbi:MAG TPA: histidine kinase [Draconibacterium sp.]|nr:histidine kinase [Draconibacterium sp.]
MELQKIHIDKKSILFHSAFWLSWIILFTIIQGLGGGAHKYFVWFMYYIITLPIFAAHTYLIAYWLLPKTFFKGKNLLAITGVFAFLVIFSVIELIVSNEVVFRIFDESKMFGKGYLNLSNIIISGIGNQYIILVFLAIKVWQSWYYSKKQTAGLMQIKIETELEIYRFQLQPKLILSMIEELETVAEKEHDKLPQMIVKMSGFLNHFLFEVKDELIPLSLEVKLISEFIDIHKFAIGKRCDFSLIVNGNLQAHVCPPLLLLPVINSALKVVYDCNNTFENTVIIKAEKKYLLFTFMFWSEEDFSLKNNTDSEIIKKRLMFNFPSKHRIIENTDANFVEISLEIFS